ncbi:MAG: FAD-dependent oxidoreductase [Bacteroidota bacterium]
MLSFWEHKTFTHYDYIIIGGGITGLSTACAIKEKRPKASVLLLERGLMPSGASTKNAGFACVGSFSEKQSDLELMGEDAFLKLIEDRWVGLYLLRKRLGDDNIDFQHNGGFELVMQKDSVNSDKIYDMNVLLQRIFNDKVFYEKPELVERFGFNKDMVKSIILNPFEGQLDTGKMMQTLSNYAGILRIKMLTGAEVKNVTELPNAVAVSVKSSFNETLTFTCDKVAYCTNAFSKQFFPDIDITPGRGQVICTSPIENLPFKGVFSFDEGYYYFRNIDNRIIFGGGRNLDFEAEQTTDFAPNSKIIQQLEFYLAEMIAPQQQYTIDYQWQGIMAFGKNKLPIVQKLSDRQFIGARLNGMGIALGSKIADELCTMMLTS